MLKTSKRHGFILLTSVGLSTLITLYTLTIMPMKQQSILILYEEHKILVSKQKNMQYYINLLKEDYGL